MFHHHHDFGIIGGADGPTRLFFAHYGGAAQVLASVVLFLLVAGVIWLFLSRRGRK